MPRIVRGLGDNIVYHVINRGNRRQEVFHKEKDYEAFVKLIKEAKERYPVKLYGYCLMPNHFHMAVRPERAEEKVTGYFSEGRMRHAEDSEGISSRICLQMEPRP